MKQLHAVHTRVQTLVGDIYKSYRELLPDLARNGIEIVDYSTLPVKDKAAVDAFYQETIFPVLTPLAFDPGRPFPHISNLSLNLAVVLQDTRWRGSISRA